MQENRRDTTGTDGARPPADAVDEASDQSFPASDPPSFDPGTCGSPNHGEPANAGDGRGAQPADGERRHRTGEMRGPDHAPAGTRPIPPAERAATAWGGLLLALAGLAIAALAVWWLV